MAFSMSRRLSTPEEIYAEASRLNASPHLAAILLSECVDPELDEALEPFRVRLPGTFKTMAEEQRRVVLGFNLQIQHRLRILLMAGQWPGRADEIADTPRAEVGRLGPAFRTVYRLMSRWGYLAPSFPSAGRDEPSPIEFARLVEASLIGLSEALDVEAQTLAHVEWAPHLLRHVEECFAVTEAHVVH